jgi:hypothetical protein
MFAMKDTKQQARQFASPGKAQNVNSGIARETMASPTQFLQRSLGNSYLQSTFEDRRVLGETGAQNGVPTIQRKCACGGSCASCAADEEKLRIQTKLSVGAANDVYEQEADRVADQILRMPEPSMRTEREHPHQEIKIQRLSDGNGGTPESTADININPSGGHPLSSSTRQFMEPRFGADLSHVRLHTDQDAHHAASQIQARAFTHGHHVWLGKGESDQDRHLLAHELRFSEPVCASGSARPAPLFKQENH